ncbi:MAG: rane protein [Bacteroidetes bacterium]|nr:rane protein [Bacteroidota bacterium]
MKQTKPAENSKQLYKQAFGLALFTIIYNIAEGLVSIWLGYEDESLALFGFGVDSFIEVISGLGIAHMIIRIQTKPDLSHDRFERTALRITGFSLYALAAGLVFSGIYNIVTQHKPETTFWGIVIALISIAAMWMLIRGKIRVGKKLNSDAILADAECTRVCIYMSVILLFSSGIYELTGFAYIDSIGSLGLSYFAFSEAKESFKKAKNNTLCSCGHGCTNK